MSPSQGSTFSERQTNDQSYLERPQSATTQALLFDPNELIEENSVVATLVKTNIVLLQKCLKSQSKAVYFAAIENIRSASDNFGPAINKHLKIILPLV